MTMYVKTFPVHTPFTPVIEAATTEPVWAQPVYHPYAMVTPDPVQKRMAVTFALAVFVVGLLILGAFRLKAANPGITNPAPVVVDPNVSGEVAAASPALAPQPAATVLSPVFTPEVQFWANDIGRWAAAHGIGDPNLVAIVMQIESCGFQDALSSAGATGLFQVMPFHFDPGEVMLDPETNAYRGMLFFADLLQRTSDVGLAFAGYNGGPSVMVRSWDTWPNETQRYYRWATGIYQDIQNGHTQSETLQRWLEAGGSSLCQQAAARQAHMSFSN